MHTLRKLLIKLNADMPHYYVNELLEASIELVQHGLPVADVMEGLGLKPKFGFYLMQEVKAREGPLIYQGTATFTSASFPDYSNIPKE
jgi:hypothetical protein